MRTGGSDRRLFGIASGLVALAMVIISSCSSGGEDPLADAPKVAPEGVHVQESPCDPRVADFPYHVAWAKNEGDLPIYPAPGATEPFTTLPNPRPTDSDPPIPVELAMLVRSEPTADGCAWVEVDLPTRPNGSTGWVKRSDIQMEGHVYRIEIDLGGFALRLYEGDTLKLDAPIATAADNTPTPGGVYYTTELIRPADPNGLYGHFALGLSGYSDTLTTFNGGAGQLGIHGTNEPDRIGTQVSHGCIRMLNEDVTELVNLLGNQTLGTPVYISA